MDAQVNFKAQEQAVEGFVNALQELKAMMKSLNDLPAARLRLVDESAIRPLLRIQADMAKAAMSAMQELANGQRALQAQMVAGATSAGKAAADALAAGAKSGQAGNFESLREQSKLMWAELAKGQTQLRKQAMQAMRRDQSASKVSEDDTRHLLGVPSRDEMKSFAAQIKAQMLEGLSADKLRVKSASNVDVHSLLGLTPNVMQKSAAASADVFKQAFALEALRGKAASNVDVRTLLGLTPQTLAKSAKDSADVFKAEFSADAQGTRGGSAVDVRSLLGLTPTALRKSARESADVFSQAFATEVARAKSASNIDPRTLLGLPQANNSAKASASVFVDALKAQDKAAADAALSIIGSNLTSVSAVKSHAAEHRKLADSIKGTHQPTVAAAAHMNDLHSAARGVASGFNAMWLTWGAIVPLLAGAAVSNAFTKSVKSGMEFEQTLAKIGYLGETSATNLSQLSAEALKLGSTTQYGPLEVANGLKTLTLAGLSATESMQAIKPAMDFATVSEMPLEKASESLLAISKAFGYQAKEMSVVGDIVAKTAASTMSSVTDMTEAFRQSSTIAQMYGVTIEDQSVMLGLLSQIGIKGSAAGTSVRNMYVELMGTSKKAREILEKKLELNIFDNVTKAAKPLPEIFQQLSEKLAQLKPDAALKLLNDLGNERGTKSIAAGLQAFVTEAQKAGKDTATIFEELQAKLADSFGFVAKAAAGMSVQSGNQLKAVGNALEASLIKAFDALQPTILQASVSMREFLNSAEFVNGLKSAGEALVSLGRFLYEHIDAIKAAGAVWLTMKAVQLELSLVLPMTGAALKALTAAGVASNAALAASLRLLGPVVAAVTILGAAYLYLKESKEELAALDADKKAADAAKEAAKAEKLKLDLMIESIYKDTARIKELLKNSGDQQKATEALRAAEVDASAAKLKAHAEEEAAIKRKTAARKLDHAAALESDPEAGEAKWTVIGNLKSEAQNLLQDANRGISHAESEGLKLRNAVKRNAQAAKQLAEQANARIAAERTGRKTGSGDYKSDAGKSAKERIDALKLGSFDELKQIEKRYNDEVSTIKSAEQNKQTLLKASHDAKLIETGEFYARELALAAEAESRLLARAESSATAAAKAISTGRDAVMSKFQNWVAENQDKKGFSEKYLTEWERVSAELAKLDSEYESFSSKLANDKKTIGDNAATRITLQAIKAEGAIKALAEETKDFWKAEADSRAAASRATATEDLLRYATPEAAAYISAAAQAQERLTKIMLDNDKAVEKAEVSLLTYAAALEWEWQVSKEQTAQLGLMAEALGELKKRRDALAGKAPEMVSAAGDRALTKFKKDEEAQLIKGVADAIETGLFEGGTAGKKKLRDLIVAELRKPISLMIQAVVQPMMGALLGGMGIGTAAAGQAGGSMLGSAAGSMGSSALFGGANLTSLGSAFGEGFMATLGGSSISGGSAAGLLAGGAAPGTGMAGALGAAAPYAIAAAVVLNALGAFRTTKTVGGGLSGTLGSGDIQSYDLNRKSGTLFGGPDYSIANMQKSAWSDMIQGDWRRATTSVVDMAKALNLSTEAANGFTAVLGTDIIHPDTGGMGIKLDDLRGKNLTDQQYAQEVQKRIAEAILAGSDELAQRLIGSWETTTETISKQVQVFGVEGESTWETVNETVTKSTYTVSEYARSNETAIETLTRLATSLVTVNQAFTTLGFSLEEASLAGGDAASNIVDAYGGKDAFSTLFSGYYENYYSAEEKRANSIKQITNALNEAGADLTAADIGGATRSQFRAFTEAVINTKGATDPLAVALIKVSGEFKNLTDAVEESLANLKKETGDLQIELMEELGLDTDAKAMRRSIDTRDMTAAETGIYDYNQTLRDQIDAAKKAKEALKDAEKAQKDAADAAEKAAEDALKAWQDAQRKSLEGWYDGAKAAETSRYEYAQRELDAARETASAVAKARISAAQASVDAVSGIATALANARESLVGVANQPLTSSTYKASLALVQNAASAGNLQAAGLEDALKVISGDTQKLFGRFEDWAMSRAAAAEPVSKLDAQAKGQMAAARAIIDEMNLQEEEAKLRYDEAKRVLGDQHDAVMDSMKLQYETQLAQIEATNAVGARFEMAVSSVLAAASAGGGGGGGVAMPDFSGLTAAIRQMATNFNLSYEQAASLVQKGASPTTQNGNTTFVMSDGTVLTAPTGSADAAKYQAMWDTSIRLRNELEQQTGAYFFTGLEGEVAYYKSLIDPSGQWNPTITATNFLDNLKSRGVDTSKIGSGTQADLYKYLEQYGIKPYATGINVVPHDQLAYIHKGEAVVPAAFNPFNPDAARPMSSDDAAVVAELRTLNARTEQNEALLRAIAGHLASTDRKWARVIKSDAITTEPA